MSDIINLRGADQKTRDPSMIERAVWAVGLGTLAVSVGFMLSPHSPNKDERQRAYIEQLDKNSHRDILSYGHINDKDSPAKIVINWSGCQINPVVDQEVDGGLYVYLSNGKREIATSENGRFVPLPGFENSVSLAKNICE